MVSLVKYLATNLADDPKGIEVYERAEGSTRVLELCVSSDDMGKVIGKHGRTAKAIRTVVSAAAQRYPETYDVEIVETPHHTTE